MRVISFSRAFTQQNTSFTRMVFATDFDPTTAAARRKSAQPNNPVAISPVHQTNRLIAQATQSQAVTAQATANRVRAQKKALQDVAAAEITPLPLKAKPSLPMWLQVLTQVQHGSTVVASLLIAGALVLYGSSVYTDKSTEQALTRLNHLQSESQQLTAANEAMKQSLAEQAMDAESGLEPYEAGDILFVTPESLRPTKAPVDSKQERIRPLGY